MNTATPNPLDFWAECLAPLFGVDITPEAMTGIVVPQRTKEGVAPKRIGTMGFIYGCMPGETLVMSRIEARSNPSVTVLDTDLDPTLLPSKRIAQWLVHEARPPFMVGEIGNAGPIGSFALSTTEHNCFYCKNGSTWSFNLAKVRAALSVIQESGFDWKKDLSTNFWLAEKYRQQTDGHAGLLALEATRTKLLKIFTAKPGLRETIQRTGLLPGSGEHRILAMYFAEKKDTTAGAA